MIPTLTLILTLTLTLTRTLTLRRHLATIKGIGPAKLKAFGSQACNPMCHGLQPYVPLPATPCATACNPMCPAKLKTFGAQIVACVLEHTGGAAAAAAAAAAEVSARITVRVSLPTTPP